MTDKYFVTDFRGAIDAINKGDIAVIPTDTLYGLCAKADNKGAVSRLYRLKNRSSKPGTIIASSIDQLVDLGIKRRYLKAVESYWPSSLSIEIPHSLDYLSQSTGRQAFRIVAQPDLVDMLNRTGPLLTSSCNKPGEPPSNNIDEAILYFGNKIDVYVDGGDLSDRRPSTLIAVNDDVVEVIREGSVTIDEYGRIVN